MQRGAGIIMVVAFASLTASPGLAAQGDDPDWPCVQRKVPELSIGQVWSGQDLPGTAADWSKDATLVDLVDQLAARRLPLQEAQQRIRAYRAALPEEQKPLHSAMLVQGLFDKMNHERSQVISGIARYAHAQRDLATILRQESAAIGALRAKPEANSNEIAVRIERLAFQTRIFQERVQALSFVCEVPTLIEQRLFALVKTLAEPSTSK